MKVLEDETTKNRGRKLSPCVNQNISGVLVSQKLGGVKCLCRRCVLRGKVKESLRKAGVGLNASAAVAQAVTWRSSLYSNLFPKRLNEGCLMQISNPLFFSFFMTHAPFGSLRLHLLDFMIYFV